MTTSAPFKPRPPGARKKSFAERMRSFERPPVTHGYFKSFDGIKLFYSLEGKGKPLIFCYGLVCSSLHWTYQIEYFQRKYQATWFDYRGHQNSEVPENMESLSIENSARDLGILMDELNIQDAVILGHSMGVNVVLEFYRQQPERVAAMVLANGTAKRPLETIFNSNAAQAGFAALHKAYQLSPKLVTRFWQMQKGNPLSRAIVALGGFNPHLTPEADIQMYVDQVAEMDPRIFLRLIETYENYDATPWLHTIKAPTLIIAGENDRITPPEQQELLHQLIPGSQLEVIRHGSHCAQMDLPELVNHKIEAFLERIGYTTQAPAPAPQATETAGAPEAAPTA